MSEQLRLGVYVDLVYRDDHGLISTDLSFVLFVTALAPVLGEVILFGRLDPTPGRSPYQLPHDHVRFVPLPHYPRVTSIWRMLRSFREARAAFARELSRVDAVWLFGPHPVALSFARIARQHGIPLFLGVRQDFPSYIASRLPSRAWLWAIPLAHTLEHKFRRLARNAPTLVVGDTLSHAYLNSGVRTIKTTFSLVRADDVVPIEDALSRPWDGELELVSVGRLDAEKNPLLLPEILAELRRRYPHWNLTIVGSGPLADAVRIRAAALGVSDALKMAGYVPFGDKLWGVYRASHAFLHVSLTEGVPHVLLEAQAAGLPIVATGVGGVASALGNGALGELVPARDASAAAEALERLRLDGDLRRTRISAGLAAIRDNTLDAELDRIAQFFRAELAARSPDDG